MFSLDRPHLYPRRALLTGVFVAAAVSLAACGINKEPISSPGELTGCIIDKTFTARTDQLAEKITLLMLDENRRKRMITAIGENTTGLGEQFNPGDWVRIIFSLTDSSGISTGRDQRQRQQDQQLTDMIAKGREFVLINTREASTRIEPIEKNSRHCTG